MAAKRRVPPGLREQVRQRANGCCEYCLIHDQDTILSHEADHVIAEMHGGQTTLDNLAWACASCNRYKSSNLSSLDPMTGHIVPLYHPRRQQWQRHFQLNGPRIEARTATGRATIHLLRLNETARILDRVALISIGHYPPV